jgi:hypothetical protein
MDLPHFFLEMHMWQKIVGSAIVAAAWSCCSYAQPASNDYTAQIAWCAQDRGLPDCPVTYQTLRADECLSSHDNRSCLIRMAKEAAAAGDCSRAYRLVYACQCNKSQESARAAIATAGQNAVCKYLTSN